MKWQWLNERWLRLREAGEDWLGGGTAFKLVASLLVLYVVIVTGVGWYWSREPDPVPVLKKEETSVAGEATTAALIGVVSTLLDKPGGFLANDIFPPGVLLDNMPSWEYGALVQSRDLASAMRESFSRSQSQSQEDRALARAEPRLNFSTDSWMLPASESEYRGAVKHLKDYLHRLRGEGGGNAQFYARADNLRHWLSSVESRLGSLSQQLSASVGKPRLDIHPDKDPMAREAKVDADEDEIKTPWLQIDNVFYEARGTAWALLHFLRAVEVDFADVLDDKNARVSLQQIIRELEATQAPIYSPVILNGGGFGLMANHSLVMASYISRAHAALIDLRELMAQG